MWQACHLDGFLASQANENDWVEQARFIQEKISDQDIESAVRAMPSELYTLSGQEIEAKLKQRKSDLHEYATEYYEMLARKVNVAGF